MYNFKQSIKKFNLPFFSSFYVCFDFGTYNTRIAIKEKGKVLEEPTYIGYNTLTNDYIFFGKEAKNIVGKTPDFIKVIHPVVGGVISDFDSQVALVKKFLDKSIQPYLSNFFLFKPQLTAVASVPSIATEIEQRAVEEVLTKIGFSDIYLIKSPLAAAYGAGVNVFSHHPSLLVEMGAGLIELAVISGGGIIVEKTLRSAGEAMNQTFSHYIYLKYGVIIGESTTENLKTALLTFDSSNKTSTVRGKSLENGLPKSIRIKTDDVKEALMSNIRQIIDTIKEIIELSPPEVVDEIYNRGVILTGGMADIPGIDRFFAGELKIDVVKDNHPQDTVLNGLLKLSNVYSNLKLLSESKNS